MKKITYLPIVLGFLSIIFYKCEKKTFDKPKANFEVYVDTAEQLQLVTSNTLGRGVDYKLVNSGTGSYHSFWSGKTDENYLEYLKEIEEGTEIDRLDNTGMAVNNDTVDVSYRVPGTYNTVWVATETKYYSDDIKRDTITKIFIVE